MELREAVLLTRLREHLKRTLADIDEIFGPPDPYTAQDDANLQKLKASYWAKRMQQTAQATAPLAAGLPYDPQLDVYYPAPFPKP